MPAGLLALANAAATQPYLPVPDPAGKNARSISRKRWYNKLTGDCSKHHHHYSSHHSVYDASMTELGQLLKEDEMSLSTKRVFNVIASDFEALTTLQKGTPVSLRALSSYSSTLHTYHSTIEERTT